jgi:hypothetical protein
MTLYEELGQAFKLRKQEGEDYTDFAIRASTRVNKCTDAQWKELSAELQTWNNSVMELTEGKSREDTPELPELEGFPVDEEETAVDEDGVVQEEASGESEDGENTEEGTDEGVDASAEGEEDVVPQQRRGKSNKQEKKMPRAVTAEKEKAPPKAVAKKAAAAKPAAKKAATNGARMRLDPEAKIKIVAKENPNREGSGRYKRWAKYKDGMTVKEAIKAGFSPVNIHYSVSDGHIKLV